MERKKKQFYRLFKIHRPQHFILKRRSLLKLLPISVAVMGEGSVLSWLAYVEHSHHDLHAVRSSLSCYLCDSDRLEAGLSMHVDFGLCGKTLLPLRGFPAVKLTSCAPQESLAFYHPHLTSEIGSAGMRPNVRTHFVVHNALRLIPQTVKCLGRNSWQDNKADPQSVKYLTSWRFFVDVLCCNWYSCLQHVQNCSNTAIYFTSLGNIIPLCYLTFRRRVKSHLPFAGIIRRLPYSTRFQDKG